MNTQKLYRSQTNKVFAGVCGGFAEYFDVDPIVVRILFVLMVLFGGSGLLLYIAAVIIIPKKPFVFAETPSVSEHTISKQKSETVRNGFGIGLVVIGLFLLLANLEVFHFFDFLEDAFDFVFPVLLIILGMAIIYYRQTQTENAKQSGEGSSSEAPEQNYRTKSYREFRRSSSDKKIFGVCGGLAQYFEIDSSLIRMLYIVLCLASFGAGLVLYVLIAIVAPYDNVGNFRVSNG